MLLVIDAYNMLKQKPGHTIDERTRNAYIKRMATYAQKRKHYVWLLFDGGPYLYPVTEAYGNVTIMYSGEHESADSCIKGLLQHFPIDNTLLISSDRELVRYASDIGVISIKPVTFSYYLERALQPDKAGLHVTSQPAHKRQGHESSPEVDRLMQQASEHMLYKEDDIASELGEAQDIPPNTPSRHEKLMRNIVKKL